MHLNGRAMRFPCVLALIFLANIALSLQNCERDGVPNTKTCEKGVVPKSKICDEDRLYVIRTTHSSALVLDGAQASQVRVQHFTGSRTQLWRFQRGDNVGLYYIVNDYTGSVLAFKTDSFAILEAKTGSSLQQWTIGTHGDAGKIQTAVQVRNLDITGQNFTAGNPVGIWNDGDYPNQKWITWEKV